MLLGLDLGTTNVKALVTDETGRPLAQGSAPLSLYYPEPDAVEQDIEEIWQATQTAIRQALSSVPMAEVQAVGISSQGGAMQLLDAGGRPVGRVISWMDQRGYPEDHALTEKLGAGWFAQRIGHTGSGLAIGQLLRLGKKDPDLLRAPSRAGFVGDIIVERLTGRPAHDGTSGGLTLLYNPLLRDYDPDVLREIGMTRDQLPPFISPRQAAGPLRREVADELGLAAGIPVSCAIHDQYATALGTGAVRSGVTMLGTGTAWILLAISDQPTDPVAAKSFVCHHVVEGLFGQILSMVNGGSALEWILRLMGKQGMGVEEVDTLLMSAPVGSNGVTAYPLFAPSDASGIPSGVHGRFCGVQLAHGPAHLARSVVEGLAYETQRHLLLLREGGIPVKRLVMGGGAAASRVTPQIVADVTGLAIQCAEGKSSALLGAAILAQGLLEPATPLDFIAKHMLPKSREVHPGPDRAAYGKGFENYLRSLPQS